MPRPKKPASSLLIENCLGSAPRGRDNFLAEAFQIKSSDHPGVDLEQRSITFDSWQRKTQDLLLIQPVYVPPVARLLVVNAASLISTLESR
jgi:hypothetical protein